MLKTEGMHKGPTQPTRGSLPPLVIHRTPPPIGDPAAVNPAQSRTTQQEPINESSNREEGRASKRRERFSMPRKRVPNVEGTTLSNAGESDNDDDGTNVRQLAGANLSHGEGAPSPIPKLYGDVEFEEVASYPAQPSSSLSHATPRHLELHETVFVESTATGKFKKTEASSIKTQQHAPSGTIQDQLLSLTTPPSDGISSPPLQVSRAFVLEQSMMWLQKGFLWLRGLLAGYGLCQLYTSVAYLRSGGDEYLSAFATMVGVIHRTFLVVGVGCLLSTFMGQQYKSTTNPQDKTDSSPATSAILSIFQQPASSIFLIVCYLFIVITLLVEAHNIDAVECSVDTADMRRYFILNAIRGGLAVFSWVTTTVINN